MRRMVTRESADTGNVSRIGKPDRGTGSHETQSLFL